MAASDLPTDYDAIVLGTGMTECIVAAALSRVGYNVLHLDRYEYYSSDWASFHFQALQDWISSKQNLKLENLEVKDIPESSIKEKERSVPLLVNSVTVQNVICDIFVSQEDEKNYVKNILTTEIENRPATNEVVSEKKDNKDKDHKHKTDDSENTTDSQDSTNIATEDDTTKQVLSQTISEIPGNSEISDCNKTSLDPDNSDVKNVAAELKDATIDDNEVDINRKQWTLTEMKKLWRKFNIDLMPKVLYCRGAMVELLISSDVAKYCEFKTVSRVLTSVGGKLEKVPCSRSDVFSSKQVSMIEKRMMMKFLTFCTEYKNHPDEYKGFEDQSFCDFLKSKKLSANVRHYIQHSIAMVTDQALTMEGLESSQKFLQSLGRYGNTAFLWPVYGSGELPQCFCRMCAVFGGVYCLRRTAQCVIIGEDSRCVAVIDTEGQKLNTKWLIAEASYVSSPLLSTTANKYTSRAVLLTDRSLKEDSQDHITLLSYPLKGLSSPVTIFELPPSSNACPPDIYIVHLTCVCSEGAKKDFQPILENLFQPENDQDDIKPKILWSLMFEVLDSTEYKKSTSAPSNMYVVGGPNHEIDFEYSIEKAKEIFEEICPGQEFLPKAPNPEDIIWDDGEGNKPSQSGFEPESSQNTIITESIPNNEDTKSENIEVISEVTEESQLPESKVDSLIDEQKHVVALVDNTEQTT